jgi:hypothetical protein
VLAERYPEYGKEIIAGARHAFVHGNHLADVAAIAVVLGGALVVFFGYPTADDERRLMKEYAAKGINFPSCFASSSRTAGATRGER